MPTERLMREVEWPRLTRRSIVVIAVLFFLVGATHFLLSAIWPPAPTAAPASCLQPVGRYVVQVVSGFSRTQVLAYDNQSGQVWLYDSDQGIWKPLPALPERSE